MNIILSAKSLFETRSTTLHEAREDQATRKLEVNVIHTTDRGTRAALKTAGELAADLGARINLVAPRAVPWALPLMSPPVTVQSIEQRLVNLVSEAGTFSEVSIYVLLCRNKKEALMQSLKPKSLVVMGCKMPWWPGEEKRLVKKLSRHGHRVIFACER